MRERTQVYIAHPELVVVENRKVPKFHVTAAPSSGCVSHLTCRHSPARFSYIPASGGSGMQISPIDTVTNSPFGVVLQQGWRGGSSRTRPQSNAGRMMLTDRSTAPASPLAPGVRGDSAYSLSLALRKQMNTTWIDKTIEEFAEWHEWVRPNTRIERHEAMKALLFVNSHQLTKRLEYLIDINGRKGLVDFVDNCTAIEIDDGPNKKSLRKLNKMRELGRFPVWILILANGKGGRARAQAKKANVLTVRVMARNNTEVTWEWLR